MNRFPALAVAIGLAFSTAALAQVMSKADVQAAQAAIAADYKSANAGCASLSGNAKDICRAEATGKRNVARAELQERRAPGEKSRRALAAARADADYKVARERCDDKSGDAKKLCISEARTARGPAPAPTVASKKENAREYVDDSVITAKVKAAVFEEPSLKSAEINVETSKGRVQLSGFVRSRADINKAVEVARKVKGVASVQNVMIVKGQQ